MRIAAVRGTFSLCPTSILRPANVFGGGKIDVGHREDCRGDDEDVQIGEGEAMGIAASAEERDLRLRRASSRKALRG